MTSNVSPGAVVLTERQRRGRYWIAATVPHDRGRHCEHFEAHPDCALTVPARRCQCAVPYGAADRQCCAPIDAEDLLCRACRELCT